MRLILAAAVVFDLLTIQGEVAAFSSPSAHPSHNLRATTLLSASINNKDIRQLDRRVFFRSISSAAVLGITNEVSAVEFSSGPSVPRQSSTNSYIQQANGGAADPTGPIVAAAVIFGGSYAVNVFNDDISGASSQNEPPEKLNAKSLPYGLADGKKDVNKEKELPPWALRLPTPYGIEYGGKNPYIQQVEQYCEKGKVNENCTDSIKSFVENAETTGATVEEAETIVGYLESLSDNASNAVANFTTKGKRVTSANFETYLAALSNKPSECSDTPAVPAPASAIAVKEYLDGLSGLSSPSAGQKVKDAMQQIQARQATPTFGRTAVKTLLKAGPQESSNANDFDRRLSRVEERVNMLENKVEQIPDQIFDKFEAWQTNFTEKLADEMTRAVHELSNSRSAPRKHDKNERSHSNASMPAPNGECLDKSKLTIQRESVPTTGKGMTGYLDSINVSSSTPSGRGSRGYLDGL
mmetsp:Transcript_26603/g.54578  ORF Transcript_26603/g.54578 Transcript_26603/m.54578 type:complete len:468 (-) Transcript_26603:30-1433(-)